MSAKLLSIVILCCFMSTKAHYSINATDRINTILRYVNQYLADNDMDTYFFPEPVGAYEPTYGFGITTLGYGGFSTLILMEEPMLNITKKRDDETVYSFQAVIGLEEFYLDCYYRTAFGSYVDKDNFTALSSRSACRFDLEVWIRDDGLCRAYVTEVNILYIDRYEIIFENETAIHYFYMVVIWYITNFMTWFRFIPGWEQWLQEAVQDTFHFTPISDLVCKAFFDEVLLRENDMSLV